MGCLAFVGGATMPPVASTYCEFHKTGKFPLMLPPTTNLTISSHNLAAVALGTCSQRTVGLRPPMFPHAGDRRQHICGPVACNRSNSHTTDKGKLCKMWTAHEVVVCS